MTHYSIDWTEAGNCYEGQGLTLKECNNRLASIQSKRLSDNDQSGWYFKTSVSIISDNCEYQARIDFCPRTRYWPHAILQDHIKNTLKYSYRMRHDKNTFYAKIARENVRGAIWALKIMKQCEKGV